MNELQTIRNPAALGAEIRALTQQFKYMTLMYGVEVGRRLTEAKEMLPHGEFGAWLSSETEFSAPTASRFMRLYNEYGGALEDGESNVSTLKKLSVSNALRLLALPAEERESFAEEHNVELLSARELDKLIAERDEARRALEEAEEGSALAMAELESQIDELRTREENGELERKKLREQLTAAQQTAADTRKVAEELAAENEELRNRPIDVAVQVDEEAVKKAAEEAKEKADAEWAAKLKAAEADAEKRRAEVVAPYEKQVKELSGKAAEADKLREQLAEAEKRRDEGIAPYEEEISSLRKQLAMSGVDITIFKVKFNSWQSSFNELLSALKDISDEIRDNCIRAVRAVLERHNNEVDVFGFGAKAVSEIASAMERKGGEGND